MYVYILSESAQEFETNLWTVGFYKPDGKWEPESDHSDEDGARRRVHYLNGGSGEGDDYGSGG